MGKAKKRTLATIGFMSLVAVVILLFYYYWSNRVTPLEGTLDANLSESEKILAQDFQENYPATPRETVKCFARIIRALYSNETKEDEIDPLALKVRQLYDEEFLKNNPENIYLLNLKSDIASWKEKNRYITNYLLVNEELEEEKEMDGVKYSVNYVSYTIQESGKFTETWKVLLRQDSEKKWRILGWEIYQQDNSEE